MLGRVPWLCREERAGLSRAWRKRARDTKDCSKNLSPHSPSCPLCCITLWGWETSRGSPCVSGRCSPCSQLGELLTVTNRGPWRAGAVHQSGTCRHCACLMVCGTRWRCCCGVLNPSQAVLGDAHHGLEVSGQLPAGGLGSCDVELRHCPRVRTPSPGR